MMLMLSLVFGTSNSRRDDLGSDLSGSLPGLSDLGYAGGRTPAQAAYAAGSGWVDLNRVAQDDPTQGDLVTSAESLRRAMYQLEADGGDSSRDLDAFFSRLESADLPMASRQQVLAQGMQVIGLFLELGDPEWVTWFALGEYVRVLTLSSRVSQQLGLRLADVAEADEAVDVLRQLVDQLESYGVAAPVLQVLHRIQDLLQDYAVEAAAILEQTEALLELLSE